MKLAMRHAACIAGANIDKQTQLIMKFLAITHTLIQETLINLKKGDIPDSGHS